MNAARFGLPEKTVVEIGGVLAGHPAVEKAILYGSRAKENYKRGSDIDLTLVGNGLDHRDLLKIMDELDELLLPYTIDLSILHMIDHAGLLDHIQRVGKEFYRRQDAAAPQGAQPT
jgi:predicted nucleotidyltransferase